jgi:hypothetical protein
MLSRVSSARSSRTVAVSVGVRSRVLGWGLTEAMVGRVLSGGDLSLQAGLGVYDLEDAVLQLPIVERGMPALD